MDGYYVYPRPENLWKDIDRFLATQDGLCFGTNVYAGWEVMRLASRHVKVVINGQGSDEIFGGYARRYDPVHLAALVRRRQVMTALDFLVKKHRVHGLRDGVAHVVKDAVFGSFPEKIKASYLRRKLGARFDFLRRLAVPGAAAPDVAFFFPGPRVSLNRQLCRDQARGYLPMLLRYDDRNAAAASIENRVPFLDHRLVEYVNRIPSVYKICNGWNKWLLRLAMRGMLPDEIVWRREKNGFATPQKTWLSHGDSPVHSLVKRHGIKIAGNDLWSCLVVDKLLGEDEVGHAAEA